MTKVQLNRVKILIEELEKLRKGRVKFDMGRWCELEYVGDNGIESVTDLRKAIKNATKNPCGTAACLAGKAGLIPRIRRMGFRWDVVPEHGFASFRYKGFDSSSAIKAFFGYETFRDVFVNAYEIETLSQGIKALKEFVRDQA